MHSPRPEQPNFFRPRYYSKQQTEAQAPSVKAGMSVKKVATQRKQYVKLITEACKFLKLNQYVACSAFTFCHHFYLVRTMQKNDTMLIAMAAVFLASKSENHPRPLLDVLHASFKAQYAKDREVGAKMAAMLEDRQQLDWLKDIVLKAERALLYVLGFRFQVDQPSSKLLQFATKYKLDGFYKISTPGGPKLSQLAANFLHDMWETTLSLRHPAAFLAAGALYAAIKITKTEVPLLEGGRAWYEAAANATQQQMEVFDAELMQRYNRVPVDGKAGKKGAGAAGKPAAGGKSAPGSGKPAAAQQSVAAQHVPPAPGTPVSSGSAPAQRAAAARERTPEDSRSGGNGAATGGSTGGGGSATANAGGGADGKASSLRPPPGDHTTEPAAKRARTDAGPPAAAPPAAPQRPLGVSGGAANPQPSLANGTAAQHAPVADMASAANGMAMPQQNGVHTHAGAASGGAAAPAGSAAGGSAHAQQPQPEQQIPGLAATAAPAVAQPGSLTAVHRAG